MLLHRPAAPTLGLGHQAACEGKPARAGAPKNGKGQKAGHLPPDRAGHSITRLPNGHLLVFGGMDNLGGFHNDLWEIDLPKLTWFSLLGIAKGAPPKPRAYHS